jgi:putative transposase
MRRIDELFMEMPFLGSRQMRTMLRDEGRQVGRGRVRRLMRKMGLMAVYAKPRTSKPHPEHTVYPYLLRNLPITKPNQVWCADISPFAVAAILFLLDANIILTSDKRGYN